MAMQLEFSKLHGCGNDFVFVNDMTDELTLTDDQVKLLCHRQFGIGADGVIVVKPPQNPENHGFMHYINADATLAQMCGNGVRCFAKYLVDYGIVEPGTPELRIETRAGVKTITYVTDNSGKLAAATVDMGAPILDPEAVPTTFKPTSMDEYGEAYAREIPLESPFGTFEFTCISMGNPHAITFVEDVDTVDLDAIGAFFESHPAFPEKTNVEFAQVTDQGIRMRVYERGCGETLACGTGACATNVAAYLTGRTGNENDLLLRGGTLHIDYHPGSEVMMTGPAVESFRGTITV